MSCPASFAGCNGSGQIAMYPALALQEGKALAGRVGLVQLLEVLHEAMPSLEHCSGSEDACESIVHCCCVPRQQREQVQDEHPLIAELVPRGNLFVIQVTSKRNQCTLTECKA